MICRIITTIAGSMTGAIWMVMSDPQTALPLDVALAYLAGGLAGFALTLLWYPVSS